MIALIKMIIHLAAEPRLPGQRTKGGKLSSCGTRSDGNRRGLPQGGPS